MSFDSYNNILPPVRLGSMLIINLSTLYCVKVNSKQSVDHQLRHEYGAI